MSAIHTYVGLLPPNLITGAQRQSISDAHTLLVAVDVDMWMSRHFADVHFLLIKIHWSHRYLRSRISNLSSFRPLMDVS